MATLTFHDLRFAQKEKGRVVVEFLGNYEFETDSAALKRIGKYEIGDSGSSINFPGMTEQDAGSGFNAILNHGLENLTNRTTGKRTLYVHRFSGIPLIGTTSFGIIDRNTSLIEVRPLTGCNMNCIFCSVDEGLSSRKTSEVVVEEEYLVAEVEKLAGFKGCDCDAIINAQGEPTLYRPLPQLVSGLRKIAAIKSITLVTNGTLLTERLVDELASAGLTLLNISLNAVDPKTAGIMEGSGRYDVEKVKKVAAYAAKKLKVTLTPVMVGGYNEAEMEKIVAFAKDIGAATGMQNFLRYKQGRAPRNAAEVPWPRFYEILGQLEKRYQSKLILSAVDYSITRTKPLPKPFRKGQTIKAKVVAEGRYPQEYLAAAEERSITLPGCEKELAIGSALKIRILSDKHNIFYGKVAR